MSLLSFPNEILYLIARNLKAKDLSSLLLTNSFFAKLTAPLLHDIFIRDKDGLPVLCWAAGKGYLEWCHRLLEKRFDVNITSAETKLTPLHQAAKSGHGLVIKLLLRRGAMVNILDFKEQTPLHHAAKNGQRAAAHLLLQNHADIGAINYNQKTPLSKAIGRLVKISNMPQLLRVFEENVAALLEAQETAILLLRSGANIFRRNVYGENALHQASGQSSLSVLRLILDMGGATSLEARENRGNTALHIAVIYGQGEVVKLLLEENTNIDARNMDGDTPLHLAVEWQRKAILKTLIKAGVDVNLQNLRSYTALALAVYRGYEGMVGMILEASPCFDSSCNAAALYLAVDHGWKKIVNLLLESGARTSLDLLWHPRHQTVLHLAVRRGHLGIAKALLEKGADRRLLDLDGKCAFCEAEE